ncbi:MAG: DUF881 domain-containing protein [Nocardioidaceae bacterium]
MTDEPPTPGPWSRVWRALRPGGGSDGAKRPLAWRLAVPVACACVGLLATTSMVNARGTDLRGGRSGDLIDIVAAQRDEVSGLQDRVESVQQDIEQLTQQVGGSRLHQLQEDIDALAVPSGLTALEGPGLYVALDDAPMDQDLPDDFDTNRLVVHQQDIQAVVNALWAGGAEGISLQGQRIIATTGIKCVGNTVLLQGVPYAPPYEIVAVGDATRMYDELLNSPQVLAYRSDVAAYDLGWELAEYDSVVVPAYTGTPSLEFARPAGASGN